MFLALKFDEALLQDKAEEGQRKGRRGHKGQKGDAAGAPDSAAAGAGERLSKKQRKAEKRKMAAQLKREVSLRGNPCCPPWPTPAHAEAPSLPTLAQTPLTNHCKTTVNHCKRGTTPIYKPPGGL